MDADQPYFRFNPNAYREGNYLEASDDRCDVCTTPCGWKYTGVIYATTTPTVCARCIASGALARFMADAQYTLHDIVLNGAEASLETELLQRTPGVACFNPFEWPVLDGWPLAFLGYGPDPEVAGNPDVQAAIAAAYSEMGWDDEEPNAADPYALVFKEVYGERYRAVIDLD